MGKKKVKSLTAKNGKPQNHVQKSFKDLVAEAATETVKPYVQQQLQFLGYQLQQENVESMRTLYTRMTTLENLCLKQFNMTEDQLAELVADSEDKASGYSKVDGVIEAGDYIRLTIETKAKDQDEFKGLTKLIVENVGIEPLTLGTEIEPLLIGLKTNEPTELEFGKDKSLIARVNINRISRKPKVEKPQLKAVNKEEVNNEGANTGA